MSSLADTKKHALTSRFPKDFLWGTSTASHQVEGGTYNQWTVWELENAQELARTAHERLGSLPLWPDIKAEATKPENYVSGKGVEHYSRYKEDFALARSLNFNSLRFGIEWSRLEPEPGQWDEAQFEYYRQYIHELKSQGLEPILNLWHWTVPVWFDRRGGFKWASNLKYWRRFVEKVSKELLHDITYVITLNEPNVYASFGYITGEWPPQEKNWIAFLRVYWHLVRSHRSAYKILKSHKPKLQIGIAHQLANIQAKRPHNFVDQVVTKWMRYFWNWWFINRIKKHQDFAGFNYYFTDYYKGLKRANPEVPLSDLGWYMEPEGMYPILLRLWAHYKKPIIITENGLADAEDAHRQWWIEESLIAVERAISEGVEVKGYLHWSLLDNFEWKYGWWPKFGLVSVDREHGMKRTVRPSAKWYAAKIKELQKNK